MRGARRNKSNKDEGDFGLPPAKLLLFVVLIAFAFFIQSAQSGVMLEVKQTARQILFGDVDYQQAAAVFGEMVSGEGDDVGQSVSVFGKTLLGLESE